MVQLLGFFFFAAPENTSGVPATSSIRSKYRPDNPLNRYNPDTPFTPLREGKPSQAATFSP